MKVLCHLADTVETVTLSWVRLVIAFQSLLSYNSGVQLDWSFNSKWNGLCFIQIDAVEVEISFFLCNQQLLKIIIGSKSGVVICKNSSKLNISDLDAKKTVLFRIK